MSPTPGFYQVNSSCGGVGPGPFEPNEVARLIRRGGLLSPSRVRHELSTPGVTQRRLTNSLALRATSAISVRSPSSARSGRSDGHCAATAGRRCLVDFRRAGSAAPCPASRTAACDSSPPAPPGRPLARLALDAGGELVRGRDETRLYSRHDVFGKWERNGRSMVSRPHCGSMSVTYYAVATSRTAWRPQPGKTRRTARGDIRTPSRS
jgi:hypothetical protein